MNKIDDCWKSWTTEKWNLTDSLKTPLGPVFDQRWEEFTEHGIFDRLNHPIELRNTTAFSISVRAAARVTITLCNGSKYKQNSCYSIIIGNYGNTKSVIQKCSKGIPMEWQESDEECRQFKVSFSHKPLSATEWRTFLITWDSVARNISVFDAASNTVFMKYQDNEQSNSSKNYHMFIASINSMFYRFHIYTFLHTTVENAILRSPIFQFNNKMICIQLLAGLCAECDINITLYDATHNIELKQFTVKGSSKATAHGLPTWQFVTIEHLTDRNSAIMEVRPILNSNSPNPLWAIANVRQCPRYESFRKGVLSISVNPYVFTYVHTSSNLTCQKLFYDEHTVVSSLSDVKSNMNLDDTECPEGKFGPRCSVSCDLVSNAGNDCKDSAICYQNGCTCFPACQGNMYGQNCNKTCDSCMVRKESTSLCNKVTGVCNYGCNNHPNKLYIPPMCQMSITKPGAPLVNFINTVNIQVKLLITWKEEYDGPLFYSFIIQTTNNININGIRWKPVFQNVTELTGVFTNLKSNVIYYIICILRACNQDGKLCNDISSERHIVEINCNQSNFFLIPEEHSLSINWKNELNQLYSCVANRYMLIVQQANTSEEILNTSIDKLPYKVSSLPSYTLFNVIILQKNKKIFSKQIRTLKEAPLKISNLRSLNVSDTNVTLSWMAPKQLNEEKIMEYEVTLQVKKYYGCTDSKPLLNNPNTTYLTNDTTITIQNLHPYALYNAEVVVYNSQYNSEPEETTFETKVSAIATEVYSNINVQGWNMTWEPPEDCRTITGPLYSRIQIYGISDDVKDVNMMKQTAYYHLSLKEIQLDGAERYMAKLYVIRRATGLENHFAYQTYEFETPSKAPPKVINLEVYEIDSRQNPTIVYLRWQRPRPPLNGILHAYRIRLCERNECTNNTVESNAVCNLWDNYICGSIQRYSKKQQMLEVVASNVNVSKPGIPFVVSMINLDNAAPDQPDNFTITTLNNSVVDLQWCHPWKTGSPLEYFRIQMNPISTNLQTLSENDKFPKNHSLPIKIEFMVSNYTRNYHERLYLLPSTQYLVSIQAVTYNNRTSKIMYKNFETPSTLKFNGHLKYMLSDSMISLDIPPVLNNTKNSMIHVIVKGPKPCEEYLKVPKNLQAQAGVQVDDDAWQAAELPTLELAGKPFIVGNNLSYGNAKNCPLRSKEFYEITVIITEHNQNVHNKPNMLKISIFNATESSTEHKKWLIFIILIFVVPGAAFYFYQRYVFYLML
ncbi:hypothetical protein X777_12221 [Ooceraea biroi]|uniref:Fibronectin type-III domain-containing protein n=1 Tax=Ooceraea biroi TaxID=2015173 RepID=A0A026W255_OOCBI|nr:hypothetical protein X777_12221 [Ooceraea biroi]